MKVARRLYVDPVKKSSPLARAAGTRRTNFAQIGSGGFLLQNIVIRGETFAAGRLALMCAHPSTLTARGWLTAARLFYVVNGSATS